MYLSLMTSFFPSCTFSFDNNEKYQLNLSLTSISIKSSEQILSCINPQQLCQDWKLEMSESNNSSFETWRGNGLAGCFPLESTLSEKKIDKAADRTIAADLQRTIFCLSQCRVQATLKLRSLVSPKKSQRDDI